MSPPGDYSKAACRKLSMEELEGTFWYPGPANQCKPPSALTTAHWDRAKEVCSICPLRAQCLMEHLEEREGIYGGLDQYERYLMRRRRARTRQKAAEAAREAVGWTEAADAA